MIYEGFLIWRISKDKILDFYVLLLEDFLVLLQKQDEKLLLKCYSKIIVGFLDSKQIFSFVFKFNVVFICFVVIDKWVFFIICIFKLGLFQIYELVVLILLDKNIWMEFLEEVVWNVIRYFGVVLMFIYFLFLGFQELVYQGFIFSRVELDDLDVFYGEFEFEELFGGIGFQQRV